MAYATHQFQSAKADGTTPGMLQPSHWNAQQPITLEANENFITDAEKLAIGTIGDLVEEAPIDGSQYARKDGGWEVVADPGAGDVTGPASSVDGNIAVFDGITGKIIKDSGVPVTEIDLKATQNPGICAETPISANDISIDYTTRVLTITPPLGYFHFFTDGGGVVVKHVKTGNVSFPAFTDTSGVWYFYFDNNGDPITTQAGFPGFSLISAVYRLYWNATLAGSAKSQVEAWECHTNTISAEDHTWKHRYGTIWLSGFTITHNRLTSGAPNADGRNAVISLSTGSNIDDNLTYTVTNGTGAAKFEQDLGHLTAATLNATNSGQFKIRDDDGSLLTMLPATRFPFPWDSGTNRPEYITGGTRSLVSNLNFFICFVYALQDPRNGEAIKVVPGYTEYTTLTAAQAITWTDIRTTYTTLADNEIRPLYKLIFEYRNTYDVGSKYSVLRQVDDIRQAIVVTSATASGSIPATNVTETNYGNTQTAITSLKAVTDNYTPASTTGAASLQLAEDTDNGTNKVTLKAAESLSADYVVTLPSETGTLPTKDSNNILQSVSGIGSNSQSDSYTLVLADAGKTIYCTKATANTVTIPANASVAFPVDTIINVAMIGAGAVSIAITSDTLNAVDGLKTISKQYSTAQLRKVDSTTWILQGCTSV